MAGRRNFSWIGALTKVAALLLFGYLTFPEVGVALAYMSFPLGLAQEMVAAQFGWW